jgi:2-haloacid dehalogenase
MDKPRAVLFDAYGTLFDVHSVALLAEQLFPGRGERLSMLWRERQIEYTRLRTMADPGGRHYRPFWELTRAGLRAAALRLGITLAHEVEEQLMNQYRHLSAFPEDRPVLTALKERGVRVGVLSNGDPDMLAVAIRSAGLSDLIDPVVSVQPARAFKPDPRCYTLGQKALGLPARSIVFVSGNSWDAIGATWFGFTTLWINRGGLPPEQLDTEPTRTGTNLRDVLGFFDEPAAPTARKAAQKPA